MKIIFSIIMLISSLSFADQSILCYNQDRSENFSINTQSGKILLNNQFEVTGAVYSGVNSSTNYNGEILGEINTGEMDFYITIVVRNIQNKISLETIWYPKAQGDKKVLKAYYENCSLK